MVPFKCDVHGWMNAYVNVVPHPFFAVTRAVLPPPFGLMVELLSALGALADAPLGELAGQLRRGLAAADLGVVARAGALLRKVRESQGVEIDVAGAHHRAVELSARQRPGGDDLAGGECRIDRVVGQHLDEVPQCR
jgi:hypothetical protein